MAIGPERAIGTGPIGEGPIGPQPDAGGDVTFGWFRPFTEISRVAVPLGLIVGGVLWVPFEAEAAPDNTVTIDRWQQPLSRAVPVPPVRQGHHLFVPAEATVENTTVRVWPLTQGEKSRPIARVAPVGHHLFVPNEATLENTTVRVWPLTQGLKAAPIACTARQGHHLFVPKEATVENTTNTVWPLVVRDEKAIPIPRVAPPGGQPFIPTAEVADNTRNEWDWYLSFPDRAPHTLARQGHHLFVPAQATVDNTTNTVWPLTQGVVARPIPRPALGFWAFGYPYESIENTRSEWDWYIQWPHKAPQFWWKGRPYQPFVPDQAVVENTVTPDKWLQAWKGPPRYWPAKTQITYQVTPRIAVVFSQDVFCNIILTVDFHICGWGTETQASDASDVQAQESDAWVTQAQVSDTSVVESETGDTWSEQDQSDDDYDEQDECGR